MNILVKCKTKNNKQNRDPSLYKIMKKLDSIMNYIILFLLIKIIHYSHNLINNSRWNNFNYILLDGIINKNIMIHRISNRLMHSMKRII